MTSDPARPVPKPCTVAVFAPSPALTVTIEQGSAGAEIHLHAGGQGFWVARMAARLGAAVSLCVPLGGETGSVLAPLLAVDGIEVLSVPIGGSNGAYVHDRRGQAEREVIAETPSPELRRHELDDLYGVALTTAIEADIALLTGPRNEGVLPADTYERLASDLKRNARTVLADLSGECLFAAVRGGADLAKVSDEELLQMGWMKSLETDEIAAAARRLHEMGAPGVVVSRGERGSLASIGGHPVEVSGPRFTSLDQSGAGDSMFAGLGVALGGGLTAEEALRVATAAGSLNVTRHGLGTGHLHEISTLAGEVEVKPLGSDQSPDPAAEEGSTASTTS